MQANLLESFQHNGYVVVDNLIEKSLFDELLTASNKITTAARHGNWEFVRAVGQNSPSSKPENLNDIWGVQHLMHYKLNDKVFAEFYGSQQLLTFLTELNSCTEDQFQLELLNLMINPMQTAYEVAWHRGDEIPLETPEDLEAELLKIPLFGCQWNTALLEDDCLIVVPGSHNRVRTIEERKMISENSNSVLPNQVVVKLKPGQTVFYNQNILRRAVYQLETVQKRRTLHASIGLTVGGTRRAANVFKNGLGWMTNESEMKNFLLPRLFPMYQRLLALAQKEERRTLALKDEKRLKWGILSTGAIATKFVQALVDAKSQKHQVVAIATSSDIQKCEALKNSHKSLSDVCCCYSNYAELCADPNVDIVYVATPNSHHYRNAMQALTFNKNVLVEKAFTVNIREAETLVALARRKNLFVMEALWTKFMHVHTLVTELLEKEKFGVLHLIAAELCINFNPTDLNGRLLSPNLGGGSLLDVGVYPLSWITSLIKRISGQFQFPSSIVSSMIKNKITEIDETSTAVFYYDSVRVQAILNCSVVYDAPSICRIQGSHGSLVISGGVFCPKKLEVKIGEETKVFDLTVEGNGLIHQADHVEECLRKGLKESPVMSPEETILNIKIIEEIRQQNGFLLPGEEGVSPKKIIPGQLK